MALNNEFSDSLNPDVVKKISCNTDSGLFDSLSLEVVKKKYYNANKVDAVIQEIQVRFDALQAENRRLTAQLDALNSQKAEIGDAVLSAQTVYKATVSRARAQADDIVSEACRQRDAIIGEATKQQEYAVRHVGECYRRVKDQYQACIEAINDNWQSYLCGLSTEGDSPVPDIEQKVGAIAQEMFSLDKDK